MTTEIIPANKIQSALKEANITDQVLMGLKVHLAIKVKNTEDKEGYALARKARLQCKELRVLASKIAKAGREEALAEQRAWIAEEKRVVGAIEAIETYLESQEKIVDEAQERAEQARKEAEEKDRLEKERLAREKFEKRVNALMKVGVFKSMQEIVNMVDSDFEKLLKDSTEAFNAEQIRKAKEQEELDAKKVELEKQRKEQEKKEAEQREAQKKIDEDNRKIELAKAQEEARLRGIKEAEEKAKRDSEEKARKEAEAKKEQERLEALKPDKIKLADYATKLALVSKPELETEEANEILKDAIEMLGGVIKTLTE